MAQFTPPSRRRRLNVERPHGLLSRIWFDQGLSVLKTGSSYRTVEDPTAEDIEAADVVYLGGRTYPIDGAEQADLTAAGYGAYIT